MEMLNVIEEQYIVRRRKPVKIILDSGLIHPAVNGRVARNAAIAERRHAETGPRRMPSFRSSSTAPKHDTVVPDIEKPAKRSSGVETKARLALRLSSVLDSLSAPKLMAPVFIGLGLLLLVVAIAAVGAVERRADLDGFFLPEDGASALVLLDSLSTEARAIDDDAAMPALPMTLSMSSYRVAKNDTLDAISRRYGIRLDTLISVNRIADVRRIGAGTTLKIPNIDGVAYTVKKGENLSAIASARGVSILDIVDANDLSSQTIVPGQSLFIPGARLSSYDLKKALGKLVIWPVAGRISSNFGYRANPFTGIRQFHSGLDIVGPFNTGIKAAMDGRVAETGYSSIYGNFVILSHPEGYQTLYAHLNKINVRQGSSIMQGAVLGLLGTTGYSTGPHLHFGVFRNGAAMDPLRLLNGK